MKTWQVLAAIGVGSFLAVLLVCGGAATWFGFLVQQQMNQQMAHMSTTMQGGWGVSDINYSLQGPTEVTVGETFILEAIVENTASHAQQLHSLENYSNLIVRGSEPAWKNTLGNAYVYELDLPPGTMQIIRLEVEPVHAGYENVNVDVNINSMGNYAEAFHSLNVQSGP